jgi:hypothetical protein
MPKTTSPRVDARQAFYRYAASADVLAQLEAAAVALGREQFAQAIGRPNDIHLHYNSSHQFWVALYARQYALQLGGDAKAKKETAKIRGMSQSYVDAELAASIRAMVKEEPRSTPNAS